MPASELAEVVRRFRDHPGRLAKASLKLVTDVLGPTDWLQGPGDDAAVIPRDGRFLLAAGEAIFPPFVEADPFGAGVAAVVANVNDVAAMGGRPFALVDTIVGPEALARRVLEGMRFASERYGVSVVGGHLTLREGPPAVSAFVIGEAVAVLSSRAAAPGQALLLACALEGAMRGDFLFFSSLREREDRVGGDIEILARIAEAGSCVAAKDVSMAGVLGSLAMLLEPSRVGVVVDLERLPRPPDVGLADWTAAFPSYGFLLCAPDGRAEECAAAFHTEGLACEEIGVLDGRGVLSVALRGEESVLLDVTRDGVTRLDGGGPGRAPHRSSG
ncbi:MAG: AIR synthase related protein [Actinomycetota bacterium]